MTSQERLRTILDFGIPDRIGMVDISYWPETLERWHKEGMPENVDPVDYFGLDRIALLGYDHSMRLEEKVIEETDRYTITKNADGVTIKSWKEHYATPLILDATIKTPKDWAEYKPRLQADESRLAGDILETYRKCRERGDLIVYHPPEVIWLALRIMGHEQALIAMLEEPEMIYDIIGTYTDQAINMLEIMHSKGIEFDALWFFGDLCYKNGMLFSPKLYRELGMPHHKRLVQFCKAYNLPVILHCDGDVRQFIPLLIEAGIRCIQPLEARCGNDVRELKRLYDNQIVFFGNISVEMLSRSKKEVEEEVISKVTIAKQGGGYIYHSDHSVPPSVSLENYSYAMELLREYGRY